ncbi:hypothetical protein [Flavobacterium macrobrachii]|uniref:Uncharacterized protein n=1 Tax=Flavobacterium macrobrachii TaxID=591204 RepID=A0ABS2CX59_9FLAO|nr:hypothetical protein [Flavobacterium macrobrachii]MBM6498760.1 hypothetical protein [Flavobacterium macrobrachii]
MMRIKDIEDFFIANVVKREFRILSFDSNNNASIINSSKLNFDFDEINKKIKTSDTIFFKDGKVIFVEFKRGKIPDTDFRLKATESIISFYNYVFLNGFKDSLCFPSDLFQIYIVYDRNNCTPIREMAISSSGRKLQVEYKHFFSKYEVIDNDRFQKIFKI